MTDDVYILELDGMQQSAVDLDDPTRLSFDYMRRIADVIDRLPPGPLRVLHVGGAAMSLPRYVHAMRPRSAQIVLEPNAQVIERVRAEAPLPQRSGIKVRPVDGASGVRAVRDGSQDVVVLDAFADALTPPELLTVDFAAEVRRVLTAGGVLLANLVDRAPFGVVRDLVAALTAAFGSEAPARIAVGAEPSTLKGRRSGNLVVVAGELPDAPFGEPSPMAYRVFMGSAVRDSFGGGTARRDVPDNSC
ncbi:MAG: fused MFS/spermidine synthase [Nocardioides sp.]|nr:fused MFS/spermidine synthase [Nocardioides sp.]